MSKIKFRALESKATIECQTCGWVGSDDNLVAQFSDMEPGCPQCSGTDFLEQGDKNG